MCLVMPVLTSWVSAVPGLYHAGSGGGQKDPPTSAFHMLSVSASLHSSSVPPKGVAFKVRDS